MNGPDWTYWLQMMNFAMVAVVVLAGFTVVIAVVWDLQEKRLRQQDRARNVGEDMSVFASELHHIPVAGLGLTMADGGEELKPSDRDSKKPRR
jgi:hypothetical protein